MKKWWLFVLPVLALALPASAQSEQPAGSSDKVTSLGADIGYFAPFENNWNGGFTGRAVADFHYWDPIGLRFTLGLADLEFDPPGAGDRGVDVFYGTAGVIYTFNSGKVYPYAHAGIGFYNMSGGGSSTEFGFSFGGGVEMPLAENIYFVPEVTAHMIAGDGPSFNMAFTLGIRFQIQ